MTWLYLKQLYSWFYNCISNLDFAAILYIICLELSVCIFTYLGKDSFERDVLSQWGFAF